MSCQAVFFIKGQFYLCCLSHCDWSIPEVKDRESLWSARSSGQGVNYKTVQILSLCRHSHFSSSALFSSSHLVITVLWLEPLQFTPLLNEAKGKKNERSSERQRTNKSKVLSLSKKCLHFFLFIYPDFYTNKSCIVLNIIKKTRYHIAVAYIFNPYLRKAPMH